MSNIYERIGEAFLSNGKHDIIRAESKHEEEILSGAGFTKIGSLKEGDDIIALFKIEQKTKEVIKVVHAPIIDTSPWNKKPTNVGDYPWNNRPYVMNYAMDTGTGGDGYMQYKGNTTSLMNAAYNPLSILEDYNFPKTDNAEDMTNRLNSIYQTTKPARNV